MTNPKRRKTKTFDGTDKLLSPQLSHKGVLLTILFHFQTLYKKFSNFS